MSSTRSLTIRRLSGALLGAWLTCSTASGTTAASGRWTPLGEQLRSPVQQAYLQRLTDSGWGQSSGPQNVLVRVPEVGSLLLDIGLQLRQQVNLSVRQREIAILMAARAWTAQREWAEHAALAHQAGLSEATLAALARQAQPTDLSEEESVLWSVCNEVLYHRQVGDATFVRALQVLGAERMVNATMLATFSELLDMLEVLDTPDRAARGPLAPMTVSVTPLPPGSLAEVPSFPPLAADEGPNSGQFKIVGGRFRPLKWSEMTVDQSALARQLLDSWRHSVSSVFIPLLRSARMASVYERLGSALSPRTTLMDTRLRNFATLMVTRDWNAQFEYWAAHRNVAAGGGVTEAQVTAIRDRKRPPDMDARLAAAYDVGMALLERRRVTDALWKSAQATLGDRDLIGTVVMIAFYGVVASQTEALDRYPMPASVQAELPE